MKVRLTLLGAAVVLCTSVMAQQPPQPAAPAAVQAPQAPPLRVFIHAGLKTHAEGQHDYPQFLADWSKLLTNRGAIVDGGLHFPSARELAATDVIIIYKGDAGYLSIEDRTTLDNFLRRGGGLVSMHDALCGPEPEQFAGFVGGAKKHGEVNYTLEADVPYTDRRQGASDHAGHDGLHDQGRSVLQHDVVEDAGDSRAWRLPSWPRRRAPGRTRAKSCRRSGPTRRACCPGAPAFRAFVWMQGHNYVNFSEAQVQPMLLRGIAWAGKRPADALATERPQRGGGRGGRGRSGGAPGESMPLQC